MAKTAHAPDVHVVVADKEARPARRTKHLHRVTIERAKNGGHSVVHAFRSGGTLGYEPDVTHVFGKQDGPALLKHLRRHLGIRTSPLGGAGVPDADGDVDGDEG
jgi:hypothetical protein